jgi:hypothetical protein
MARNGVTAVYELFGLSARSPCWSDGAIRRVQGDTLGWGYASGHKVRKHRRPPGGDGRIQHAI